MSPPAASAATASASWTSTPRREGLDGDRSVHRAGVEERPAESRATARATVDLPDPAGPSMAMMFAHRERRQVVEEVRVARRDRVGAVVSTQP